jgi:hypothetical protein
MHTVIYSSGELERHEILGGIEDGHDGNEKLPFRQESGSLGYH